MKWCTIQRTGRGSQNPEQKRKREREGETHGWMNGLMDGENWDWSERR